MYPTYTLHIVNDKSGDQPLKSTSYLYLITFFLKIGSISFGGFMALIGIIQKEMVTKDKRIDDRTIVEGMTLASILPGPLAVNTVCFIGYKLKGFWGAILSMISVILPSFVLIILLTSLYYTYGGVPLVIEIYKSVIPAIIAIIFTVGITMHKKHISDFRQYALMLLAVIILQFVGGMFSTVIVISIGAVFGILFFSNVDYKVKVAIKEKIEKSIFKLVLNAASIFGLFLILLLCSFLIDPSGILFQQNTQIATVFSSISLTLFGGGYVIIPIIQESIVENLQWLSAKDFNAAITLSQITPGPILVSATFIGFKMGGLLGAAIATISIFFPSGLLMILLSNTHEKIKNSQRVKAAFMGIRPVIIGLIYSACITLGLQSIDSWVLFGFFLVFIVLILKLNLSSVQVILIAIGLGTLLYLL